MTPDKRLNQLEPVVADIAQKQDRLIGQMGVMAGELAIVKSDVTEVKTNTSQLRADVIRIEKKADTTAAGLANLTIEVRQGFERIDNRLNSIEGDVSTLKSDVSSLKSDVIVLKADVSEIKQTQRLILENVWNRIKARVCLILELPSYQDHERIVSRTNRLSMASYSTNLE